MPLPIIGAAVGAVARRLIPKAATWAGKQIGRAAGAAARRPATAAAAAAGAGAIIRRVTGGAAPRGFGPPALPQMPTPQRGPVRRTIERVLPGGRSGREFTPYEGTEADKIGRPIAVYPETAERFVAPPGYVIVYPWATRDDRGEPLAMLKGAARAMGLWKPKPKPPVSGWDARAIRRAAGATSRVKRLAKSVGLKTTSTKR